MAARVEGEVLFHDVNLYGPDVDPVEVRRRIGMVFQKPNPFPKSIYDNVAFGPRITGVRQGLDEIVEGEVRTLRAFFTDPKPTSSLLIAEADGRPQGFVFLEEVRDYFTLETHGHVGILAVAAEAEGRGVGRALMQAAEEWARSRGYRKLTLSVFEHNRRARALYEHAGFAPDTIKYLKPL